MAPMYTYSKTKGLYAGISLEGSVMIERRDANVAKVRFLIQPLFNAQIIDIVSSLYLCS
jgi:lipid-binding SYLF domain-containing protein